MKLKQLGNTDILTMPIIFGGNVLGWTIDEKQSFEILDQFIDAGFNTIDTANVYSVWAPGNKGGESETIIGNWLKARGNRDQLNIITKVGAGEGAGKRNLTEKHILEEADKSLKRLQIETIDLYLTHWDDEATPIEETLGAYQKLIEAGKVRYIGASNLSPERLSASLEASQKNELPRYEVFQPEYNLFMREGFENGTAHVCQQNNLGVINYYSLAEGFLSGKYRTEADLNQSQRGNNVRKFLTERGFRILAALDKLASKYQVSHAAISLAWLQHKSTVTAPIASATKPHHIKSFIEASNLNLQEEDMLLLETASAHN